jgi:flagellar protein FlbT
LRRVAAVDACGKGRLRQLLTVHRLYPGSRRSPVAPEEGKVVVPLVVHLRKGQQVIVNGAVLENITPRGVSFAVRNAAAVLRSDDILAPEGAVTPASRVYYALQCAYLFPERSADHLASFFDLLDAFLQAAPSAAAAAALVLAAIEANDLYGALKAARELIQHERKVLLHVEARLVEELQHAPAASGEPAADRGVGAHPVGPQDEGEPDGA